MNNLSVLPFYESLSEQNARRWWVYGRVYPLYSMTDKLLPCMIHTTSRMGYLPNGVDPWEDAVQQGVAHYSPDSVLVAADDIEGEGGGSCISIRADYLFSVYDNYVYIYNVRPYIAGAPAWGLVDGDGNILAEGTGDAVLNLSTYQPEILTECWLHIQLTVGGSGETYAESVARFSHAHLLVSDTHEEEPLRPILTELYTVDGVFVRELGEGTSLWITDTADTGSGATYLTDDNDIDALPEGQYYLKVYDGARTWFSDVFTAVEDYRRLILLRWWDDETFVLDDGREIPGAFRQELWLRADIAKPEYRYEEEGETRDGHFYATKQISEKVYKFNFLAPEYLLDVVRLIPLADHVRIEEYRGGRWQQIDVEQILFTPEWEAEGDLAGVAVEFQSDTVAKKVGLAYIRNS